VGNAGVESDSLILCDVPFNQIKCTKTTGRLGALKIREGNHTAWLKAIKMENACN
jgi:hypothetical protein